MGILGKATDKVQYELQPVGEYVWTLWDLLEETGQYGQQVKWVWLISPVSDPDAYVLRNPNDPNSPEKEIWQYSKPSIAKGSRARIWTEALMGRELRTGEEPDDSDLIRRRMLALLVHKANKNDPSIKREAISEEIPARPFVAAQPQRPAARSVAADASGDEIEAVLAASDELRKKARAMIRNAQLDGVESVEGFGPLDEIDVSNLADGDLETLRGALRTAMLAAA